MNKIMINNISLGDEVPKICVPVIGRSDAEILEQSEAIEREAERLVQAGIRPAPCVDIVEFRADYYDNICNQTLLTELLKKLKEQHKDRLLLFTFRTEEEGGELRHDRAGSMLDDIYAWAMVSGYIDLLDVELLSGNYRVVRTATKAKDLGIGVVLSYHNFEETPHTKDLEEILWDMEQLGGDILKIAVTPKTQFDVHRILELTDQIKKGRAAQPITKPVVLISMTKLGEKTRTEGAKLGSAFTFGTVSAASAPGQIPLEALAKALS
ncbi:MAG: type I 3-dehydroquinate dehydratase [Eubacterium sp.]|nr:type I 3-dehydroquinate dehydratase [Eubacterium sp.]